MVQLPLIKSMILLAIFSKTFSEAAASRLEYSWRISLCVGSALAALRAFWAIFVATDSQNAGGYPAYRPWICLIQRLPSRKEYSKVQDVSTWSFCKETILDESPQRVKIATPQMFCKFSLSSSAFFPISSYYEISHSPLEPNSKFKLQIAAKAIWKLRWLIQEDVWLGGDNNKTQVKYVLKHSMTGNICTWWKGFLCKWNSTCTSMHCFFPLIHYLCKTALGIFLHIFHSLRSSVWGNIHKTVSSGMKKGNFFNLNSNSILSISFDFFRGWYTEV